MHIASVELENIKSYRRQTIELTNGLNAVCGLNGSGKTTVLEAIGFAVFDYLPYSQQSFLREGEKTGTIRVRLLAHDGREYEVVRRVGSSSAYYVSDVESGTRLAERGENVLDWIRVNALGIDGEADLKALFKNAVGVPQGLMTSDFLNAAAPRKSIFDPLLRVEEYRKAWESLRDTVSNLRDRTAAVDVEIARLETDVEKIPDLVDRENELKRQIADSDERIARIVGELEEVSGQKQVLDAMEENVHALQGELQGREYDVRRHAEMLRHHQQMLDAALAARGAVQESEEGYRRYEASRRVLAELEAQRTERDKLERDKTAASSQMAAINDVIKRLDGELREAIAHGEEAAALAGDVSRQTELENERDVAGTRVAEGQRLAADMQRLDREIAQLQHVIERRKQQIAAAQQAQQEASRLEEVEQCRQELASQSAAGGTIKRQLEETRAEGERLRRQHDGLSADVQRRHRLRREIEEKAPMAAELDALRRQERDLSEEQVRIQATLEYQNVARADLERKLCPLLELQCPVVSADSAVLDRFDRRAGEMTDRIAALDVELAAIVPRLQTATQAAQSVQELQVEAAKLESSEAQLAAVSEDLDRCRKQYQELSGNLAAIAELERESKALDGEIRRLQTAVRQAATLQVLEEQQERDGAAVEAKERDRADLQTRRQELSAAQDEVRRLDGELERLGDPRTRQQRLLATAARKRELEEKLEWEQGRLQKESDKLRAALGLLQPFAGLDDRIKEQRQIEATHQPAYERYVQNRDEAGQVEARQETLAATQHKLEEAQAAEADTRQRLERAVVAYDPEVHRRVKARQEEIQKEFGAETANKDHLERNLRQVEDDLSFYRRQAEKLAAQREERDDLERTQQAIGFIRDTIRAAGPAVTETLLSNISQIANDIYAEIMDDHAAELRWDRDYEVLVRRGPEDRKFSQLSGGEQMSAALAVRLALLKEMSEVDVAFFDEPTQNMDSDRRTNLAGQIRNVKGFNQLIVISHDDTFEHHTDNLIRLAKEEDETRVEVS